VKDLLPIFKLKLKREFLSSLLCTLLNELILKVKKYFPVPKVVLSLEEIFLL
jgi:hypothetical protein